MPEKPPPKLDLLSLALGTEFNECSISAAELNCSVNEHLDGSAAHLQTLYQIGDDPTLGRQYVVEYLDYRLENGHDVYSLSLVQQAASHKGVRSFLERVILRTVDVGGNEPQLVALRDGQDAFIPLATFARREGGTCSYVQIGDEIREDTLIATTADDGGSRQDLIEQMRALIDDPKSVKHNSPLMLNLLRHELSGKQQQADAAYEAMLVRRVYEQASTWPDKRDFITIIDEADSTQSELVYIYHTIYDACKLPDGRTVQLDLVLGDDGVVQLLARTRQKLAVSLAAFDSENGTIDFGKFGDKLEPEQRRDINGVMASLIKQKFTPSDHTFDHFMDRRNGEAAATKELIIARYLNNRGLIRLFERSDEEVPDVRTHVLTEKQIERRLRDFLKSPDSRQPFSSEAIYKYLLTRSIFNDDGKKVCDMFAVDTRLEDLIGETSPAEEELYRKICELRDAGGKPFPATAQNLRLGKTTGNAEVSVEVQRDGDQYRLLVSGKPTAMPDEKPRIILQLDFNSNQSMFSRQEYTSANAEQKAKDILDILSLF